MTILNLKIKHKGYTCTVNLYSRFVNAQIHMYVYQINMIICNEGNSTYTNLKDFNGTRMCQIVGIDKR